MATAQTSRKARFARVPKAFSSDKELLDAALQMLIARKAAADEVKIRLSSDPRKARVAAAEAHARTKHWHASLRMTGDGIVFSRQCRSRRLNRIECELLAALCLSRLMLLSARIDNCGELLRTLALPSGMMIEAMRCLSCYGKLRRRGLIAFEDPDVDVEIRPVRVSDELFENLVDEKDRSDDRWPVSSEEQLYCYLARLTTTLRKKNAALQEHYPFAGRDVPSLNRKIMRLADGLDKTMLRKPQWKLSVFMRKFKLYDEQKLIVLALLGKELGHVDEDDGLFRGTGLARALSAKEHEVSENLRWLRPAGKLIREEFIRPCGGEGETLSDDPREIAQTEYELGPSVREMLELDKGKHRTRRGSGDIREPRIRMDQLVLGDETRRAIRLALAHAKHEKMLMTEWGLGEVMPYGRNVTLLFSGPPGTGKSATAEALAYELGKQILVANYAEIQNCYVGRTEKNIAKVFNDARNKGAVLFWDEADAMFYDRDSSFRNWEVRDVSVLLQELERFPGICVLATNRKITLDKALERRITLKVNFDRPDRTIRRQIWGKLLPKTMPLAEDVDLDELSNRDLSGGEIKNVILNAARLALEASKRGPIRMGHFLRALEMEANGRWTEDGREQIGFGHSGPLIRSLPSKTDA